jgi:hypothetical protein
MNPQKRSGAKKLTPTAGFPSCNNSGRGKKLFTVSFFLCRTIYNFVVFLFFHYKNVNYFFELLRLHFFIFCKINLLFLIAGLMINGTPIAIIKPRPFRSAHPVSES